MKNSDKSTYLKKKWIIWVNRKMWIDGKNVQCPSGKALDYYMDKVTDTATTHIELNCLRLDCPLLIAMTVNKLILFSLTCALVVNGCFIWDFRFSVIGFCPQSTNIITLIL